jgi:hypothetical protein
MADKESAGQVTSDTDAAASGSKNQKKLLIPRVTRSSTAAAASQLGNQSGVRSESYFADLTMEGESSDFYYDREFPAVERAKKRTVSTSKAGKFFADPTSMDGEIDSDFAEPTAAPAAKVRKSRRGRGGTVHNVGVSKARREMRDDFCESDSSTLTEIGESNLATKTSPKKMEKEKEGGPSILTTEDLCQKAEKSAQALAEVLKKSGKLKGTSIRDMKEASDSLLGVVYTLAERRTSDEVKRLQADNRRLRGQLDALQKEVAAIRRAFSERAGDKAAKATVNNGMSAQTTTGVSRAEFLEAMECLQREMLAHVGGVVAARLEGLEIDGRLMPAPNYRPPLTADKRATMPNSKGQVGQTNLAPPANLPQQAREKKALRHAKTAANKGEKALPEPVWEPAPGPSRPQETVRAMEGWNTVVKKGRKAATKPASPAAPKAPRAPKNPKTLAVVVALKPEAAAKGATYGDVLAKAKKSIGSLSVFGVGPAKFRTGVTGARIIELPKQTTAAQADQLAEKIGAAIGEQAKVTRPVKTADIKVTGLDDSVTPEELRAALAEQAGCPVEQVKVGKVHAGIRGVGAAFASCPVDAVRRLVEKNQITVGWSSASIQLIEQRPMRCYRCMGMGHPVQKCPSAKDRSNLCFRCGCEGHMAATCTAALRCAVCTAAGKPAGHRMAGINCNLPPVKGRLAPISTLKAPATAKSTMTAIVAVTEEPMDTNNAQ